MGDDVGARSEVAFGGVRSSRVPTDSAPRVQPIAVVGLGCRYPGAPDVKTFWENVLARRAAFRRMPENRFSLRDHYDVDRSAPDKTYHTRAALLDGFLFDWRARRIPKSTFETTDIAHWLALEVALDAVRDAGFDATTLPKTRTGVVVGNSLTGEGWRTNITRLRWPFVARVLAASAEGQGYSSKQIDELLLATEANFKSVFPDVTEDTLAGGLSNTIAGRICNYLDLHGGGYAVDGACASSLLSVITAARALVAGEVDLALAGGVDISLDTFELIGFAKTGALSAADMTVYDRGASGFLPGEGCGFVVLKRLEDARRDGDHVYALLRGWGVSSDGKGGITAPSVEGQAQALVQAYELSGYSPRMLDFIEGHGTGTPLGDRVELSAIQRALEDYKGNDVSLGISGQRPVGVTSLKSVMGHTKAAAGIGGFIKTVLALYQRVVPPTAGCHEVNPVFHEKAVSVYPVLHGRKCSSEDVMRAGVSAMGFGGINSHVALESADAPKRNFAEVDEQALMAHVQTTEIILISASDADEFLSKVNLITSRASGASAAELADLSASLLEDIDPHAPLRAAFVVQSPEQLLEWLDRVTSKVAHWKIGDSFVSSCKKFRFAWQSSVDEKSRRSRPRVGFVFPGQGVPLLGMGRLLVERFGWARQIAEDVEVWLAEVGGPSVRDVLWRDSERAGNPDVLNAWQSALVPTEIAQPAVALLNMLWMRRLEMLGVQPDVVIGHSLGELSALFAAGMIDAENYIKLAALRGRAMAEASFKSGYQGAMASLACSADRAQQLVNGVGPDLCIANHNAPEQVVVSGEASAMDRLLEAARREKIAAVRLSVSAAFHSPQMQHAREQLAKSSIRFLQTGTTGTTGKRCEVISSVTGETLEPSDDIVRHVADQVTAPVQFVRGASRLLEKADIILEVGPGRVLSGLMQPLVLKRGEGSEAPVNVGPFPIEGRTSDLGELTDFNLALGAMFVQGYPLRLERVHEGRLIRPFIPAQQKVFIENVCERAFRGDRNSSGQRQSDIAQSDIAMANAHLLEDEDHVSATSESRDDQTSVPRMSKENIVSELVRLVAETTGFAASSLELEYRFLDDLHLDSIKTADIVARTAKALGVSASTDPTRFANARLSDVVDSLGSLLESSPDDGSSRTQGLVELPKWVRNFELRWRIEPLADQELLRESTTRGEGWRGARVAMLTDASAYSELIARAGDGLRSAGASVDVYDIDMVDGASVLHSNGAYTDYIAFFAPNPDVSTNIASLLKVVSLLPDSRDADGENQVVVSVVELGSTIPLLGSFFASLHLERPGFRVRAVAIETPTVDVVLKAIGYERANPQPYLQARYLSVPDTTNSSRREIRYPVLLHPSGDQLRATQLGPDDVVLVTGGARGITAECALALGKKTGARLLLIGRSPESSARKALQRFETEGVRASYRECDVTDKNRLVHIVSELQAEYGHITAVIHGAGVNRPETLDRFNLNDVDRILSEVGPKWVGARNLFDAFENAPPKLFAIFGSIIGYTGMQGNAWYALSNANVARELELFGQRHPETETICLDYSVWDEVGMGKDLGSIDVLQRAGIAAIPVSEGVSRFVHFIECDPKCGEVVIAGRLGSAEPMSTWVNLDFAESKISTRVLNSFAHRNFVTDVVHFTPGVELQTQVHLTLESDPYLRDHNFRGSYLFPTVFGLEAMAQVVAVLLDRESLGLVRINNIDLFKPIVVHPKEGLRIVVHGTVQESVDAADVGAVDRVTVGIRCETSDYTQDHFSATFEVARGALPGAEVSPNNEVVIETSPLVAGSVADLDIRPNDGLYGDVLFQGPLFQRIRRVHNLDGQRCLFTAEHEATSGWALGDPYFRDALLQSAQLCVTPAVCLPVHIDCIVANTLVPPELESPYCETTIQAPLDDGFEVEVRVLGANNVSTVLIQGYQVRLLDRGESSSTDFAGRDRHSGALPHVSEIVAKANRYTRKLREQFTAFVRDELPNCELPQFALQPLPCLRFMSTDRRHAAEIPLMHATVQQAFSKYFGTRRPTVIAWEAEGKPLVENEATLGISFAHDDEMALCTAGRGAQGCDIEPVTHRTFDDWQALLPPPLRAAYVDLVWRCEDGFYTPDELGTCVWAALEAWRKASGRELPSNTGSLFELKVLGRRGIAFTVIDAPFSIACVLLPFEGTPSRAVAVTLLPVDLALAGSASVRTEDESSERPSYIRMKDTLPPILEGDDDLFVLHAG
jgi:enediyne polyketide synthase